MFDWLWSTGPGRIVVAAVAAAAVAASIALFFAGGSDDGNGAAACGIVASGNRLCGGDLAAYCRQFAQGSLDQQTVLACSEVGVEVVK